MPLLTRTVGTPLTIDIGPGAVAGLGPLLADPGSPPGARWRWRWARAGRGAPIAARSSRRRHHDVRGRQWVLARPGRAAARLLLRRVVASRWPDSGVPITRLVDSLRSRCRTTWRTTGSPRRGSARERGRQALLRFRSGGRGDALDLCPLGAPCALGPRHSIATCGDRRCCLPRDRASVDACRCFRPHRRDFGTPPHRRHRRRVFLMALAEGLVCRASRCAAGSSRRAARDHEIVHASTTCSLHAGHSSWRAAALFTSPRYDPALAASSTPLRRPRAGPHGLGLADHFVAPCSTRRPRARSYTVL